MENDKGDTKTFIVTRVDEQSVTIDGNNPLCGREVIRLKLSAFETRPKKRLRTASVGC